MRVGLAVASNVLLVGLGCLEPEEMDEQVILKSTCPLDDLRCSTA